MSRASGLSRTALEYQGYYKSRTRTRARREEASATRVALPCASVLRRAAADTYGLSEDQEREMILDSIATIERHTGTKPAGYLAPALSHSEVTLDLFAEAGGIYTCDLFHDDQPTPVRTRSGAKFISVPYSLEMNDTIAYAVNKVEPRRYGQMIKDNFDRLYEEGDTSGTVMCIPTHNYQVSCPHRMRAFEEALEYITGHSNVWVTTGREIADYFVDHYYDAVTADIAAKQEI